MFEKLTDRRILLSGTPIQNDLSELHAMVSVYCTPSEYPLISFQSEFCNPKLLGTKDLFSGDIRFLIHSIGDYSSFRKKYEIPIIKSRAPDASAKQRENGEARANEVRVYKGYLKLCHSALTMFD